MTEYKFIENTLKLNICTFTLHTLHTYINVYITIKYMWKYMYSKILTGRINLVKIYIHSTINLRLSVLYQ